MTEHMAGGRGTLPQSLIARPQPTATWHAAGVTGRELAGPLWTPVTRGVHLWVPDGGRDLTAMERIQAVLAVLPGGAALGGWAALHWLGVTALDGRTGPAAACELPVTVCTGPSARMRRREGIDVDRSTLLRADVVEHLGVRSTTPQRSCLDIARRLGAEDGLVAADATLRAGLARRSELAEALQRMAGLPGVPAARLVAALADGAAESAPESRLRYIWVVEAGLPPPLANPVVTDRDGWFAGRVDLLDEEAGVVGEYDGAMHRALDRHTADNVREEDVERLNLLVVRATGIDLWPQRPRLVRRLTDAHARGHSRDRSRDAWRIRRG